MTRPALGYSRTFCVLYPISNDPTDAMCCHTSAILRYYDERSSAVKTLNTEPNELFTHFTGNEAELSIFRTGLSEDCAMSLNCCGEWKVL
jgi:hypothetical protein